MQRGRLSSCSLRDLEGHFLAGDVQEGLRLERRKRQRLEGKLARALLRKQEQQKADREQLKSSLRVLTGEKEAGGGEGTRS